MRTDAKGIVARMLDTSTFAKETIAIVRKQGPVDEIVAELIRVLAESQLSRRIEGLTCIADLAGLDARFRTESIERSLIQLYNQCFSDDSVREVGRALLKGGPPVNPEISIFLSKLILALGRQHSKPALEVGQSIHRILSEVVPRSVVSDFFWMGTHA
jgi:hypothetical protein